MKFVTAFSNIVGRSFLKSNYMKNSMAMTKEACHHIAEHIKNIRAKFRDYGQEPIKTVWGIGYKWE